MNKIRDLLSASKRNAAGQGQRKFLPDGLLDQILHDSDLSVILRHPSFRIDLHKWDSTIEIVMREGRKVFAILVELERESAFPKFIEYGILDRTLPVLEKGTLEFVLEPHKVKEFLQYQWEYLAHKFSRTMYNQRLSAEYILPYVQHTRIGGGGFSTVYDVLVHPAHQNINPELKETGLRLIRKEIKHVSSNHRPENEPELLFLLGSLKHRNIVELLVAYVHDGVYSLLFPPADMDLDQFLLQRSRIAGFEADRLILKSIQGLSSGLRYLHYFEFNGTKTAEASASLHGIHQDIKPKNVLVKGADFILADFGLSRLKPLEETSQTTWRDATYEYGAPECRDEITFVQGQIGRASDVWSLSCVISEVLVYIHDGSEGVRMFRDDRLTKGYHGKTRTFHDGVRLKEPVSDALTGLASDYRLSVTSALVLLLKEMLAERQADRPDAKKVESSLERIVLKALINDLLDTITGLYSSTNVFQMSLRLEENRVRAWARALGLITSPEQKTDSASQSPRPFTKIWESIEDAIKIMTSPCPFELTKHNDEFILSTLRKCNNTIYGYLSEPLRKSADGIFAILSVVTADPKSLSSMREVMSQTGSDHQDVGTIAAMRYMSRRYAQQSEFLTPSLRIERSLIQEDIEPVDFKARPRMYWYYEGYLPDERRRVLVEWRDYDRKLPPDIKSSEFQDQLEAMYRRIQGLLIMLRHQPKPLGFRILECIGTSHDTEDRKIGIVYNLPNTESAPIRLHFLLKEGGSKRQRPPHIGQRLALAKILVACLQSLHVSGWVHKDINSYNILFFTQAIPLLNDDYVKPYLVGFQHSREDEQSALTRGTASNDETKEYQYPCYREGLEPFKKKFDYYSLGLVLLEIGVWESLSSIYNKRPGSTASELKDEYVKICSRNILERMGPTYCEATMTCLLAAQAESKLSGTEEDAAIDFQKDVIAKLESCRF